MCQHQAQESEKDFCSQDAHCFINNKLKYLIHGTLDISCFSNTNAGGMVHCNKYLLKEMNKTQATSFLRWKDKLTEFQFWEPTGVLSFLSQYIRDFSSWNLEQNPTFKLLFQCKSRSLWPSHCNEMVFVLTANSSCVVKKIFLGDVSEREKRNEGVIETGTSGSTKSGEIYCWWVWAW